MFENEILFQLRDNIPGIQSPNCWCLPGGTVEKGEEIIFALRREIKEETGYILKDPELYLVETYELNDGQVVERNVFFEKYDGKQEIKCFEGQSMEFISPEKFKEMNMSPRHVEIASEVINQVKSGH